MPRFHIQAIDQNGRELSDTIESETIESATEEASLKNLTVIEIAPAGQVSAKFEFRFNRTLSPVVALAFYEQLGFLIKAGIPVFQAIKMLADTFSDRVLTEILKTVQFDLSEGLPLSQSLQKFPQSFPQLHTSLIAVGEKSGNLDAALLQLALLEAEHRDIRGRLVAAAAYPVFLLTLSVTLVTGLLLFIFPKFEEIFKAFNVKLPATTEFFLWLSQSLRGNGLMVGTLAGAMIGGTLYLLRSDRMQAERDKLFFSIPILKDILICQFAAIFSRTLSGLLASGIPLLDALIICRDTLRGYYRGIFFDRMIRTVKDGEPISKGMEGEILIPEMAKQLVVIGEKTGRMDVMMENIFGFYKKRYVERLKVMTSVLQPILLFAAAGLIATVAISLFVPLFKLGAAMKQE